MLNQERSSTVSEPTAPAQVDFDGFADLAARESRSFRRVLSRVSASLRSAFVRQRGDAVVAIDYSPTAVRAIRVRRRDGELWLDGFRVIRLTTAGSLDAALGEALSLRLRGEPVVLSLSSPKLAIRKVDLPPMTPKELREALPWEARRQIADLADDAMLDAQVLGGEAGSGSSGPMDVVLVAFPRGLYEDVVAALARLGVEPAFVDVGQMASMNGVLSGAIPADGGPLALLDLGSGVASFAIFASGSLSLFRDLGQRVAHLDRLLGAAFGVDGDQLEAFKFSGRLPRGESSTAAMVQRAIGDVIGELADDLRSGILYLESRSGETLDRVYLTGSGAVFFDRYGITDLLAAQSGLAVERFHPLRGLRFGLIDEVGLKAVSAELSAAVGLARRHFAH